MFKVNRRFSKILKKFLAVSLALLIAAGCSAAGFGTLTASAATLSGTLGTATYEYNTETKVLTLSGNGSASFLSSLPAEAHKAEKLIVGEGVTLGGSATNKDFLKIQFIYVDENNTKYSSDENGILYDKEKTTVIRCPAASTATDVVLPSTVTSISNSAFENVTSLKTLTLTNCIISIGNSAFRNASNLKTINFPKQLTSIGSYAFWGCKNLTEIILPESLETIGTSAFGNCFALKSVQLPDTLTSIPTSCFIDCQKLENINFPSSLESIGEKAFYRCKLQSIKIPASTTSIDVPGSTFAACPAPFEADENNPNYSTDEIGVLYNKDKSVLYRCPNFENEFTYDAGDSEISVGAFMYCQNLTGITISDKITEIPDSAFCYTAITSIELPKELEGIGKNAFASCKSLAEIVIPSTVSSIGESAFNNCIVLSEIVLGTKITALPFRVFYNCIRLSDIYYEGTEEQWNTINIDSSNNTYINNATIHYNYGADIFSAVIRDDIYVIDDSDGIKEIKLLDYNGNLCGKVTISDTATEFNSAYSDFVVYSLSPEAEYTMTVIDKSGNENTVDVKSTRAGNIAISLTDAEENTESISIIFNGKETVNLNSDKSDSTQAVQDVSTAATGYADEEHEISVVTSAKVFKTRLVTPNGDTITYKCDHPAVKSITANADGTLTWIISDKFPLGVKSYKVIAREGMHWSEDGKNISFTISPRPATLYSASAEETEVAINSKAEITITTSTNTSKVRLINRASGTTITCSGGYTDTDGVRTWTINPKVSKGTVTYGIAIKDSSGWADADNSFDITLTGVADNKIYSIDAPESARYDTRIKMTIVTGKDVSKVRLVNGGTSTFSSYTVNEEGNRVWEVYTPAGPNLMTKTIKIETKTDNVWTERASVQVKIIGD